MTTVTESPDLPVFFFKAEDGIRDYKVTGVQTCALPILRRNCNARSPSPCPAAVTCGEPLSRLERTLHPNLRCGSTPGPSNCARAVRMTFPSMRRHTKWKASRSNHMFAPDPAIV